MFKIIRSRFYRFPHRFSHRFSHALLFSLLIVTFTFWLGTQALLAKSGEMEGITASSFVPEVSQQVVQTQSYAIGSEPTYVITITNPGSGWMSILPVSVTFDSMYLAWVSGMPTPTVSATNTIHWDNLLATSEKVKPGNATTFSLTFRALTTTATLPEGVTKIKVQVSGAKADPDGNGPKGDEISLSDMALSISVAIEGKSTPPVEPAPPAQPKGTERSPDAVTITWQTTDESNIIGFDLYRKLESGDRQQVNEERIAARNTGKPIGGEYIEIDDAFLLLQDSSYEVDIHLTNADSLIAQMGSLSAVEITVASAKVNLTAEGFTSHWQTMDETYISGFDILRYDLPVESITSTTQIAASEPPYSYTKVNESLIPAVHSGETGGTTYKFSDRTSRIGGGGGYGYKLRMLLRSGETLLVDLGTQDPVELYVNINATRTDAQKTLIHWLTFNETIITGFNVLRRDNEQNEVILNRQMITATNSGQVSGAQYQFVDASSDPNQSYTYIIETVLVDNSTVRYQLSVDASPGQLFLPIVTR